MPKLDENLKEAFREVTKQFSDPIILGRPLKFVKEYDGEHLVSYTPQTPQAKLIILAIQMNVTYNNYSEKAVMDIINAYKETYAGKIVTSSMSGKDKKGHTVFYQSEVQVEEDKNSIAFKGKDLKPAILT